MSSNYTNPKTISTLTWGNTAAPPTTTMMITEVPETGSRWLKTVGWVVAVIIALVLLFFIFGLIRRHVVTKY